MAFTAKDVMALREKTGAGMMDCKKALTDADGNMEKATDLLRERGIAKAAKKASRVAAEGLVVSYVEGKVGVLVEVNCESDFVAKGTKYQELTLTIAKQIAKTAPKTVEELLASKLYSNYKKTVETYVKEQIAIIGENISIRRFARLETEGLLSTYIHLGGKLGVLLDVSADQMTDKVKEVAHDITLQIAFTKPAYTRANEVSQDTLDREKEVLKQQAINEGKPEVIAEKIVANKINKYYEENCLEEQVYIKDDSKTIKKLMAETKTNMKINSFRFFVMGEGIEKKQDNLAEEVAKMSNHQ